jgi:hypothetical protein
MSCRVPSSKVTLCFTSALNVSPTLRKSKAMRKNQGVGLAAWLIRFQQ